MIYLAYDGLEPGWATALREKKIPTYSPALTLQSQLEIIKSDLSYYEPIDSALTFKNTLMFNELLWAELDEALPTLLAADQCDNTARMVWRDLYILVRSETVVAEAGVSAEIPLIASYLGIPVILISFHPGLINPWLLTCAEITLNSPDLDTILRALPSMSIAKSEELTESEKK